MLKTKPYNPMEFLREEEIPEYLAETYLDDDPQVFLVALGHVIRHRGSALVAKNAGVDEAHLEAVLSGQAEPDWPTIHRVLKAIGVRIRMAA